MTAQTSRDFRFSIGIHSAKSSSALRDKARRLEDAGFDAIHLPDHLGAPAPFPVLAATPGMTTIALTAALLTSHRLMPNIILQPDERRDVIAYILSLK